MRPYDNIKVGDKVVIKHYYDPLYTTAEVVRVTLTRVTVALQGTRVAYMKSTGAAYGDGSYGRIVLDYASDKLMAPEDAERRNADYLTKQEKSRLAVQASKFSRYDWEKLSDSRLQEIISEVKAAGR